MTYDDWTIKYKPYLISYITLRLTPLCNSSDQSQIWIESEKFSQTPGSRCNMKKGYVSYLVSSNEAQQENVL